MRLLAVVSDPGDVTGSEFWIEKTKQSWWTIKHPAPKNTFHAHDPFAILFELQIASYTRTRTIRSDQIACGKRARRRTGVESNCDLVAGCRMAEVSRFGQPINAGE